MLARVVRVAIVVAILGLVVTLALAFRRDPHDIRTGTIGKPAPGFTLERLDTWIMQPGMPDSAPPQARATLHFTRDGKPMRYFPIGARASTHVALAVVEDIEDGTTLELHLAAREGLAGTVVVDLGLVEVGLPIRVFECRSEYRGHAGSFATNVLGLAARLEPGPAVERDVGVLQLDSRQRRRQQAVGRAGA